MDDDGLPIIDSGVDYTQVKPLPPKKTLTFLNQFVLQTTHFLNRFSTLCEGKLSALNFKIHRLETTLNILEAKLNSIPGLEDVTADEYVPPSSIANAKEGPPPAAASQSAAAAPAASAPAATDAPPAPPPPSGSGPTPAGSAEAEAAPAEATGGGGASDGGPKVKDDPRYAKFFKLLTVGVPEMQIQMKMKMEGLDPELLSTPDAPAPAGAALGGGGNSSSEESEEDDEFSD